MYLAELHGKLSKNNENKEDILTSNIFSFFKYSRKDIFLKGFLQSLDIKVSDVSIKKAELCPWPRLDDNTEPDFVIIVGSFSESVGKNIKK